MCQLFAVKMYDIICNKNCVCTVYMKFSSNLCILRSPQHRIIYRKLFQKHSPTPQPIELIELKPYIREIYSFPIH